MSENERVRAAPNVFARDFDGEVVVVDLEGGDYFRLDPIGARIWDGLVSGKTPHEIAVTLEGEFEVDLATLQSDILKLTTELIRRRLVEVVR